MGANATGVAARVHAYSIQGQGVDFGTGRRVADLLREPRFLIGAVVVGLLVGLVPTAWSGLRSERRTVLLEGLAQVEMTAAVAAHELTRAAGADPMQPAHLEAAAKRLPTSELRRGRCLFLVDPNGAVLAAQPQPAQLPRSLGELFGEGHPLTVLAERAGAMVVRLPDGTEAAAAMRGAGSGQVVVIQPVAELMAAYQPWTLNHTIFALAALAGIATLGQACRIQHRRADVATSRRERATARIETALARNRCGLWDWDIARGRVFWSDSLYALLGYERRDEYLTLAEMSAIIHPEDAEICAFPGRLVGTEASHVEQEFRLRNAGGDWVWLRARAEVATDPQDWSRHLVGIAVDITEERAAAERTARADERLRDAVEAISEAFVLWDPDNKLVLCNSKFRKLHGLPAEAVRPGTPYADIIRMGQPVEYRLANESASEAGGRTLEAHLFDGRWLNVSERRTKDGGFVSVGSDITALKRQEEMLREKEARLTATVQDLRASRQALQRQAQQLAELAEDFYEQKARAEGANRAKSEFLAKMSHELRTPLNAIIGFADVMRSEMFGPLGCSRYLEYCAHVHEGGMSLLGVIDDILQMSRIETGKVELSIGPIAVERALRRAVEAVAPAAAEKGLAVSCCAGGVDTIQADGGALQQILLELAENAVKFARPRCSVAIRARRAGDCVNIFVEDDGIGIPNAALSKIARPFEQVENGYARGEQGSGLGLAIAKGLAELHGGTLRIRSLEGEGTIVMVHLPLAGPAARLARLQKLAA
ncbi:MAG: PAS-domain containing protein [Methylobacteriaceae bacterium]|nr:PAS-domain containing protein [Methylobacteriaceae bacterium]